MSCSVAFFFGQWSRPRNKASIQIPKNSPSQVNRKWRGKSIFNSGSIIFHPRLQYLCPLSPVPTALFLFLTLFFFSFHTAPFYLFLRWTRDLLYTCTQQVWRKGKERDTWIFWLGVPFYFFGSFFSASLFNT